MSPLLQVRGFSKHYNGIQAVKDVSLSLYEGEIVALIGGNGAGKSTLLNLIAGLENPDNGHIIFEGKDVTRHSFRTRAGEGIALCFQRPRLFRNETCLNNLIVSRHGHPGETPGGLLFRTMAGKAFEEKTTENALDWLSFVGMFDKVDAKAGTLSGGQQKLLYISMLLMNDPKILLLDEPFANVSLPIIEQISERLRAVVAKGKTLLIVEHHIPQVRAISHRVLCMEQGILWEETDKDQLVQATSI